MTFNNQKDVHVRSYNREGHPVREYWRSRPNRGTSGFVEEQRESIMDKLFPPIGWPQPADGGPVMSMNPADVLRGGVEVTVGLPQLLLEILKNAGQATGEVLSALSPYALKALKYAIKLKKLRQYSNAVYADEVPKEYRGDEILKGGVSKDIIYDAPQIQYTPQAPLPGQNIEVPDMDFDEDITYSAHLLPKIPKQNVVKTTAQTQEINQVRNKIASPTVKYNTDENIHNINYQIIKDIQRYFSVPSNPTTKRPIPYYDNQYVQQLSDYLKSIKQNVYDFADNTKAHVRNYAKIQTKGVLNYLLSEEAYNKYGPYLENNQDLNLFLLKLMANGAYHVDILGLKPSAELLLAALDFDENAPKIPNVIIVDSYTKLEPLSDFIKEKLISQKMNPNKTPGIVHKPNSHLSQNIAHSKEMKEFIKENQRALKNGQIVTDKSIGFESTTNLKTAIHYSDVLLAYYDSNGDLMSVLLDTNDYNEYEKKLIVYMARLAQEKGDLDGFFNLFFVKIPKESL